MRVLLTALAAFVLAAGPVVAHHSWAGFEETATTFEGRIEAVAIENPHTLIELRGADKERYLLVLGAINSLVRRGYTLEGPGSLREMLKVGDILMVTGRLKRGKSEIEVLPLQIEHKTRGVVFSTSGR